MCSGDSFKLPTIIDKTKAGKEHKIPNDPLMDKAERIGYDTKLKTNGPTKSEAKITKEALTLLF